MLPKLKKLKKADKIYLVLFVILFFSVVVSAFNYKPNTSSLSASDLQSQLSKTPTSNDDDTSNLSTDTATSNTSTSTNSSSTSESTLTQTSNAQCKINGKLPDSKCTPGAIDPRVTQDNIHQTICVSGYTKTVRPSSSTTSKMKLVSMQQYGFTDSPSNYEYDHLISLELGGAPIDTKNLWPELGKIPNPKDTVENKLHTLVCDGAMKLTEAQRRIVTDWTTALAGY